MLIGRTGSRASPVAQRCAVPTASALLRAMCCAQVRRESKPGGASNTAYVLFYRLVGAPS
jgi:hypothetical protein